MQKIRKILTKKRTSPDYTRRQWIMKIVSLFIACIGLDLASARVGSMDNAYQRGQISAEYVNTPIYVWSLALTGLFMGLALWRTMEIYWWGKDFLEKLQSPMEL